MDLHRLRTLQERAARGKYRRLFMTLLVRSGGDEWRTTFENIEGLLRFTLPPSARRHSAWWANEKPGGRHTHALAWTAAGWNVAEVDMETETVVFKREDATVDRSLFDLDVVFPVHHIDAWPEGLSLRREDMYEDRV